MTLFRAVGQCAIFVAFSITIPAMAQATSAVSGTPASSTPAATSTLAATSAVAATDAVASANGAVSNGAAAAAANGAVSAANGAAPPPIPFVAPSDSTNTMVNYPAAIPGSGGGLQIQGLPGETVPWSIIVLLTGLTLIPTMVMCVTPFARLLIVFHFLRQALGLQTTPSNQTLIGLSLILTFFLMQPIGVQIYQNSIVPMQAGQITAMEALGRGEVPLRKFMSHYVRERDVALFVDLAKEPRPNSPDDLSMRVLLPAYILSELKAGFQIGTVLFLPFLIVDMVVASITTSVGMLQLPPVVISTPLKLLLFLMVDGWHLLISSLMRSFS
jgi:flagellar biosynthetic protein FliP